MDKNDWINPLNKLLESKASFYRTGLMVNNSLYPNQKVEFVTNDGSKNIKWYICGPTVYDIAHLGHARTYVGFDIIRRILENYFGYNIQQVMNITDIDDKIIKKVIENQDKGEDLYSISRKYEDLFFKDMEDLNVKYPDRIVRVTEYVPEIIKFIEKLISNGYAYHSNGSVYFDINSYTKNGHRYAKLDPSKVGSKEVETELDGVLGSQNVDDKKSPNDFALWKKSKEKEPFWNSPWGEGRPGWHIECSVMATEVLGDTLDIHTGGVDLKFPHHDNEIAQTEGYFNSQQWINYFLHTGHLHIDSLKMSKSLKNFIKIEDVLKLGYSANTFRLNFLNHKYDSEMDYTKDGLNASIEKDKYFKEFFRALKRLLASNNTKMDLKFNEDDTKLSDELLKAKEKVHSALCDNFDTKTAIESLNELISHFYKYETKASEKKTFKIILGYSIGRFVSFILNSFGLVYRTEFIDSFNYEDSSVSSEEKIIKPFMDVLSKYRDDIRQLAQEKNIKGIFDASDKLRDEVLPHLGIRLKDVKDSNAIWTFEDKNELLKEIELQKQIELERLEEKRRKKEQDELKLNTPASEWYKLQTDKYSKFDKDGLPTHVLKTKKVDGKDQINEIELKPEEINKLKKEFNTHQKKHLDHLEKKKKQENKEEK